MTKIITFYCYNCKTEYTYKGLLTKKDPDYKLIKCPKCNKKGKETK